jgi:hypothetical protein
MPTTYVVVKAMFTSTTGVLTPEQMEKYKAFTLDATINDIRLWTESVESADGSHLLGTQFYRLES